jgi:hypothetical protein
MRVTTKFIVVLFAVICTLASADSSFARGRYLHPTLGRYLSRDPIADPAFQSPAVSPDLHQFLPRFAYQDGMSLYQYERDNPVNYKDPTGLQVSVASGLSEAIATGWSAQDIAQTFGLTIEVAKQLINAAAIAKAAEKLADNYINNAKGSDPCERAKDAVRQARQSIESLQSVIEEHNRYIDDPHSYPGGLRNYLKTP